MLQLVLSVLTLFSIVGADVSTLSVDYGADISISASADSSQQEMDAQEEKESVAARVEMLQVRTREQHVLIAEKKRAYEDCTLEVLREIDAACRELGGNCGAACLESGRQCGGLDHDIQSDRYHQVASLYARNHSQVQVCETGIFEGSSAALWLCSDAKVDLVAFDLFVEPAVEKVLLQKFPGRVTLVNGSSATTLPAFRNAHPDIECQIVSIDGGHYGFIPLHDLYNLGHMAARKDHLLLMDEVGYLKKSRSLDDLGEPLLGTGEKACCPDTTLAWSFAVHTGVVEEHICHTPSDDHAVPGWCEGSFVNLSFIGWEALGLA